MRYYNAYYERKYIVELSAQIVWELFVMHALKYRKRVICLKTLLGFPQQL